MEGCVLSKSTYCYRGCPGCMLLLFRVLYLVEIELGTYHAIAGGAIQIGSFLQNVSHNKKN